VFYNKEINKPDSDVLNSAERIIIASIWHKEIKKQLLEMGVNKEKIISGLP
jgi:Fe2+ transport system protein FeoA